MSILRIKFEAPPPATVTNKTLRDLYPDGQSRPASIRTFGRWTEEMVLTIQLPDRVQKRLVRFRGAGASRIVYCSQETLEPPMVFKIQDVGNYTCDDNKVEADSKLPEWLVPHVHVCFRNRCRNITGVSAGCRRHVAHTQGTCTRCA